MSRPSARAGGALLAALAALLLAACSLTPQRPVAVTSGSHAPPPSVGAGTSPSLPRATIPAAAGKAFALMRDPRQRVSQTSWMVKSTLGDTASATLAMGHPVVAASRDVAPVLSDCDRRMREHAASSLRSSIAVPFVLTLALTSAARARVTVFIRHTIATDQYIAVMDAPTPRSGPPSCPTAAATDIRIASDVTLGRTVRTWYLWAVFPSTISADEPNPEVGASSKGMPVPRVLFDGLATAYAPGHTPGGDSAVVCRGLTTTYWLVYLPSVFATTMLDPCLPVGS